MTSAVQVHDLRVNSAATHSGAPGAASALAAYLTAVRCVCEEGEDVTPVTDPKSIGSNFGAGRAATREVLAKVLSFDAPSPVLITSEARPTDLSFAIGHLLWVLGGSDDLAWIAYYNERGSGLSDDGRRLAGAIGPRLMDPGHGLQHVLRLLRCDPGTRRAYVSFYDGVDPDAKDAPCLAGTQFWIRNHGLVALTTMRSQSALMLLPYDLFFSSALQSIVAAQLDLPMGKHEYFASSLHIYFDELADAGSLLDDGAFAVQFGQLGGGFERIARALTLERRLRLAATAGNVDEVARLALDSPDLAVDFWSQAKEILKATALLKVGLGVDAERITKSLGDDFARAFELRNRPGV